MERIEKYEILEEIGRGGMGIVYKALHPFLNKYVAIKVLPEHFVDEKDFVDRFTNEAKIIISLKHPNIVRLYDAGIYRNNYYIVMDYIEGKTIKELVKIEGKISIDFAIDIIIQICKALSYTHSNGIVHRDVKPSNILIEESTKQPYLCDFGIAKAAYGTKLTLSGISIGTPEYMSPEQCKGEHVDHRTDIYSLGIVFYEMLTGKVPFEGDTPIGVAYKHVNELPKKPRIFNPQISPYLEKIILKMIAKNPQERYSSMDEVIEDLIFLKEGKFEKIKANEYELNKSIVNINTNPSNAKVYIDGDYIGTTPIIGYEINFGEYKFVFVSPQFKDFSKKIKINEKLKNIFVDLEKEKLEITEITIPEKKQEVTYKNVAKEKTSSKLILSIIGILSILLIFIFGRNFFIKKPNGNLISKFGYLSVITEPPGAEVFLNGEKLGVSPIDNLKKGEGDYKIEIFMNGYEKISENINLKFNENKTIKYSLKKLEIKTLLKVESSPSDATVYINNTKIGNTPINNYYLKPGKYTLKLLKSGYEDYSENFEIKEGDKEKIVKVTLKKETQIEKIGKLNISSNPTTADVYINNKYYGKTPIIIELPFGNYSLLIKKNQYQDYNTNINIKEEITQNIIATLKPIFSAIINIYTTPSDADVYINDKYVGKSPIINYKATQSKLKILVKKEKYMDYSIDETVESNKEKTINIELAPIP